MVEIKHDATKIMNFMHKSEQWECILSHYAQYKMSHQSWNVSEKKIFDYSVSNIVISQHVKTSMNEPSFLFTVLYGIRRCSKNFYIKCRPMKKKILLRVT